MCLLLKNQKKIFIRKNKRDRWCVIYKDKFEKKKNTIYIYIYIYITKEYKEYKKKGDNSIKKR